MDVGVLYPRVGTLPGESRTATKAGLPWQGPQHRLWEYPWRAESA
jgi:hypothetical protein